MTRSTITAVLLCISLSIVVIDGIDLRKFPGLFNAAMQRPLQTLPSTSTCGIPTRSGYCRSATYSSSIRDCLLEYCVQECPQRTTLPSYTQMLAAQGYGACVQVVDAEASAGSEYAALFSAGDQCYLTPYNTPNLGANGAFTITFWIWQQENNFGYVSDFILYRL